MNEGYVYTIDHIKELTDISKKNIEKNNSERLDDCRLILETGDGREGLK